MFNGAAKEIPYFSNKDKAFVVAFMPLLRPLKLTRDEYLYKEGNYAGEVVFITKGKLNLLLSFRELPFKSFIKGSYFGEIEVLKPRPIREMNVKVYESTELLIISRMDFLETFKNFPQELENIKIAAEKREKEIKRAYCEIEEFLRINKPHVFNVPMIPRYKREDENADS